jgi:hypothetical protein
VPNVGKSRQNAHKSARVWARQMKGLADNGLMGSSLYREAAARFVESCMAVAAFRGRRAGMWS